MSSRCLLAIVVCVSPLLAQSESAEPVHKEAVKILRTHGLEKSQVMDHLSWICDVHGPRLTGSPNLRRAQKWALETLASWGLHKPRLEEWGPFGNGWRLDGFNVTAVGANPWRVHAYPKAWSPSLKRVEAEVVDVSKMKAGELREMDLSDKVVLLQSVRDISEPFDGHARRLESDDLLKLANGARRQRPGRPARRRLEDMPEDFRRAQAVRRLVFQKDPIAILDRGRKGDYGTIFVSSAQVSSPTGTPRTQRPRPWNPRGSKVIPQFTLAVEHYNRIARMLAKKVPVRLALELKATFFTDNPMQHNVVAEIKGTDPKIGDQIVMIGAHFDSWHSGTGATDNGCGSAAMMEAMRLLTVLTKELGHGPRRTIRVALWSGEEQGIFGSRAYVTKHFAKAVRGGAPTDVKADYHKLSGYFNMDNGTGRIRGIYMEGMQSMAPIFRAWLRPFHDLDAATLALSSTGSTDHVPFQRVYLPGFQFIQDPAAYSTRTHHSNMDNWDHAIAADLKQAATIIASFAWHTAQRDKMLPRKAWPE